MAVVAGPDLYGMTAGGVVVLPRCGEFDADLPVITGVDPALVHPGERICDPRLQRALRALCLYERAGAEALAPLSEIHVGGDGIVMYTVGAATEILLPEGDIDSAMRRLAAVLADLRGRGTTADYIDLRFRRPVVRPRDAGTYREQGA